MKFPKNTWQSRMWCCAWVSLMGAQEEMDGKNGDNKISGLSSHQIFPHLCCYQTEPSSAFFFRFRVPSLPVLYPPPTTFGTTLTLQDISSYHLSRKGNLFLLRAMGCPVPILPFIINFMTGFFLFLSYGKWDSVL